MGLEFHNPNNIYRKHPLTPKALTHLVKITKRAKKNKGSAVAKLDVGSCGLTDFMLRELATGCFTNLQVLKLDRNKLSGLAVEYLAKGTWKQLKALDLSHNTLTFVNSRQLLIAIPATL